MKGLYFIYSCLGLWSFFAGALSVNAQQTKLLTAEKHNEYGLVYSLPVTSFQIDIIAVKEVSVAGPFAKFSKIFTSDADAILENREKWSIEAVRVTPFGIPDNEETYLMQLKAGSTTFIGVADDGMLLSINKEPQFAELPSLNIEVSEGEATSGKEYLEFVNEDFTSAISAFKKAQVLADEIQEIREAKLSLTRGTAETMPTDGRQLEIMLQSLEKQEKALTQAFTGNTWKERIIKSFTFTPEAEGKTVLCFLNEKEGITDNNRSNDLPVNVLISLVSTPELPVDAKGEEKKLPKDAVIYAVPGTAKLSISVSNNKLFEKDFEMSQFGFRFGLNPSIFTDKKEPSYAVFDPATGALKEVGTLKP